MNYSPEEIYKEIVTWYGLHRFDERKLAKYLSTLESRLEKLEQLLPENLPEKNSNPCQHEKLCLTENPHNHNHCTQIAEWCRELVDNSKTETVEPPAKPWRPKPDGTYWTVRIMNGAVEASYYSWLGYESDTRALDNNLVFKSKSQALQAAEAIKKLLAELKFN